jgi:membrane protein implicated in regulation of membrane protease activity
VEAWQILAVVGVLLLVVEFFTPSFFTLPAGLAFLATAFLAAFVTDWPILLGALTVNLLVVYWIFQRHVWPRVKRGRMETNASGMIGQTAVVTEAVDPEAGTGYVKLYGDSWRVVSDRAFDVGAKVKIIGTDGNKVVVGPL